MTPGPAPARRHQRHQRCLAGEPGETTRDVDVTTPMFPRRQLQHGR